MNPGLARILGLAGMPRSGSARLLLCAGALALFTALWWPVAWLDDDCMITLRSVLHFLDGHGPVWNTAERVQTYTHPLWMFLLTGAIGTTGEFYLTTLALSGLASAAALAVAIWSFGDLRSAALLLGGCLASKAFFEYTSSGLENPLNYLLLSLFALRYLQDAQPERRLGSLMLIAGLSVTNRMDTLLLYAPALLALVPRVGLRIWIQRALLGFSPFLLWCLFALFYYGSPFPITAYAKSFRHGIGQGELLIQAGRYYLDSIASDPWTLLLIGSSLGLALVRGGAARALAIGGALYLLYIAKIGGDFMSGRFFSLPFWLALLLLTARLREQPPGRALLVALAALLAWATLHAPRQLFTEIPAPPPHDLAGGVVDEWSYYYHRGGLRSPRRRFFDPYETRAKWPPPPGVPRQILVTETAGEVGLQQSGPEWHLLDPLLCDPLLARLPTYDLGSWRVGHWMRRIPDGYPESLTAGENRLEDPALRALYDDLALVIRGPLLSGNRFAALARIWIGRHDAGLREYVEERYRAPQRRSVPAAELTDVATFRLWNDPRGSIVPTGGLEIRFDAPITASALQIGLHWLDRYELRLLLGTEERERIVHETGEPGRIGVQGYVLPLRGLAFDRVLVDASPIDPKTDDFVRAVGWCVPVHR